MMYQFEKQVSRHYSEIDRLHLEQDGCLQAFEDYKKLYTVTLSDLSMREGLGKKFGAPRRHAQEGLRSEVHRSTSSEQEINEYLDVIEAIGSMSMTPTGVVEHSEIVRTFVSRTSGTSDKTERELRKRKGPDIDMVLFRCLLCLRNKMLRRGRYLSALRDAVEINIDEPLPAGPVPEDNHFDGL